MIKKFQKFDAWLHKEIPLLILLLAVVLLRIPNFFEPYWYGDEGIYLTLGNGIRSGERLYTDIVDHKTPLIYYLAAVPGQMEFRLLTLGWMLVATIAFYNLAKVLFKKTTPTVVASAIFVLLTSVPWFEGNIPNGELFVMGFVLVGAWLLTKTQLFMNFLAEKTKKLKSSKNNLTLYLAGVFFGLGILTKVPALFDALGLMLISWFGLTNLIAQKKSEAQKMSQAGSILSQSFTIGLGLITPILISIVYYSAIGSGADYLNFGLLYNFRYAANWGLPFDSILLQQIFTLPGKFFLTTVFIILLTIGHKKLKPQFQLIAGWFILALFAALLSNRPYPHYFQQIVPPLALLLAWIINSIGQLKKASYKLLKKAKNIEQIGAELMMAGLAIFMFASALLLLNFSPYQTGPYYSKFFKLIAGQMSIQDYNQSFNNFMSDNYQAAEIIKQSGVNEIFIWGTNPMLYALSGTNPTGRFTVSFHIKDFDAYEESLASVLSKKPLFIVVMHNEETELPGLEEYLEENYMINANFEHFSMWKRLPDKVTHLF